MKKRKVNLKKLDLGKKVISNLSRLQIRGGDPFSRYTCGDVICIPPFDKSLGCPGQSDDCSQAYCQTWGHHTCDCDTVYSCEVC